MQESKRMYFSWHLRSILQVVLGKESLGLAEFVLILLFISGCSPVHKLNGRMVYVGPGASAKPGSDSVVVECPRWTHSGGQWLVSDHEYRIEACVVYVDQKHVSGHTAFEPHPELIYLQPGRHDLLIHFLVHKRLLIHPYARRDPDDLYSFPPINWNRDGGYCILTFNALPKHRYVIRGSSPVTIAEARFSTTLAHEIWLEDCATKNRVASVLQKILVPRESQD